MIRFDTKKDMDHYDNLYHQIYEKNREIERLNNIINELEKMIDYENNKDYFYCHEEIGFCQYMKSRLKELKGETNE